MMNPDYLEDLNGARFFLGQAVGEISITSFSKDQPSLWTASCLLSKVAIWD
jgi:hypothetical protein